MRKYRVTVETRITSYIDVDVKDYYEAREGTNGRLIDGELRREDLEKTHEVSYVTRVNEL